MTETVAFSADASEFTVELEAVGGQEVRFFTSSYSSQVVYTPSASGTVRFVKKSGVVYVWVNGVYAGTVSENAVAVPDFTNDNVEGTSNLLANPNLKPQDAGTSIAEGVYDFYQWESNVTAADGSAIFFGTGNGSSDDYALCWMGKGIDNDNYISQKLTNVKPNTMYVCQVSQTGGTNAEVTVNLGLGSGAGNDEYGSGQTQIGNGHNNGLHTIIFATDNSFAQGDDVYFTMRNVLGTGNSNNWYVAWIDWMALGEINAANAGFTSATYLADATFAPLQGTLLTDVIDNPSFEADEAVTNTPQGWTLSTGGNDKGARANSNGYATNGCDGDYLFNIWGGSYPYSVNQDINLSEGAYTLTALIAADINGRVQLQAGDQTLRTISPAASNQFTEYTLNFYMDAAGTVNIGAVSNNNWFKADNFQIRKVDGVSKSEWLKSYEFVATDWVTGDPLRVQQENITYNADNTMTVVASGNNNVALNLVTGTHYILESNRKYLVIEGSDLSTAMGASYLWFLNGQDEGEYYPLYAVSGYDKNYLVWRIDESTSFNFNGLLGENTDLGTGTTTLLKNSGTNNTLFGLTSTTGTSVISDINFYADLSESTGFQNALAYDKLTKLITSATTLNNTLKWDDLTTAIANAQTAADANGSAAGYGSAYTALKAAVNNALYQAGVPDLDVTGIYVENPSFETSWLDPWQVNLSATHGDSHVADNQSPYDVTNMDGAFQVNLWDGNAVAAQLSQDIIGLAKGKYTLSALLTTNQEGMNIHLGLGTAGTDYSSVNAPTVYTKVTTDELDLLANGGDTEINVQTTNAWFKADGFQLTYFPKVDRVAISQLVKTAENIKASTGLSAEADAALTTAKAIAEMDMDDITETAYNNAVNSLRTTLQASFTSVSVPLTSVGATPADGEFYLYNFATKTYLSFGTEWGTRAYAGDYRGDAGMLLNLVSTGETNRYTITTGDLYGTSNCLFASDANGVYVDGDKDRNSWAEMPWTFTEVPGLEGKDIFRLRRADRNKDVTDEYMILGEEGHDHLIRCVAQDIWDNELNTYWMLVSKQMRIDSLALATVANPVNASFYIKNPDLEGVTDGTARGWTSTNTTHAMSANNTSHDIDRSIESINLGAFDFNQTMTGLKPGLYMLKTFAFYRHGREYVPARTNVDVGGDHVVSGCQDHHRGKEEFPVLYADNGTSEYTSPIMSAFADGKAYEEYCLTEDIEPAGRHAYWNQWNGLYNRDDILWDYGYVPNNAGNVHQMFVPGFWNDNVVLLNVLDEGAGTGSLTIGVKKDFTVSGDHALMDHFRLYYLGTTNEDYAVAYNTYRTQRSATQQLTDDDFDFRELRDEAYVEGGTKVYQTELKAALATAESVFNTTNATMTSADATTLATATEALRKATEKCRLKFRLAEFYDFYQCVQTLANQDATTPPGVLTSEFNAARTTYRTKVAEAIATFEAAEAAVNNGNTADDYITFSASIIALGNSLHTDVENYIAKADPMDNNVFDLTAMLKRPDMTGIEVWADPEIYGWLSDETRGGNFNIHSNNNLYNGEPAYFGERWVAENVDLSEGWAIYQKFHLPEGEYRFTAASFASDGNEEHTKSSSNGFLTVGTADGSNLQKSHIPMGHLTENTVAFTVSDVMGASTDSLNLGIYMTNEGTKANWVGLGYMHLYKIPSVNIREDLTYIPYRNQVSTETMPNYTTVFNYTDQAKLHLYRNFPKETGRWATLCLPCNMTESQMKEVFGPNAVVNWFTGYDIQLFDNDQRSNATDGDFGAIVTLNFEEPSLENGILSAPEYDSENNLINPGNAYFIKANVPVLLMINDADYLQTNYRDELGNVDLGTDNKNVGMYDLGSASSDTSLDDPLAARYTPANQDESNGVFTFVGVFDGTGNYDTDLSGMIAPNGKSGDPSDIYTGFIIPQPTETTASYYLSNKVNETGNDDYLSEAHFRYVGSGVEQRMRGMRGYFEYEGPSAAIKAGRISLSINGGKATAISEVNVENTQKVQRGVYNLQGQRVTNNADNLSKLPKGVYIVNGKKEIVK